MSWLVMPSHGSCVHVPGSSELLASSPVESVFISKPVGTGPLARNLPEDVKAIQDALNQVTVRGVVGGPMPFLKVDGLHGPKTQAAINRFQQVQLKIFDGVIEPNRNTLKRLNEIIAPVSDDDLKAKLTLSLPIAAACIRSAVENLGAVVARGAVATGLAVTAVDRLSRHFKLDLQSPGAQGTVQILLESYVNFGVAITGPSVLVTDPRDRFDIDKKNPKIALTTPFGIRRFNEIDPETLRRRDRIHLGIGFFAKRVTPEFGAFIIVHELAHFVGRADGGDVNDFGRGWFDDTFIKPLSVGDRLLNADCFASFAFECFAGTSSKPPFVETAPGGLNGTR